MQITDTASATEYVNAWAAESASRRVTHFTLAIESQERCAGLCESLGRPDEAIGHLEAIGVIRRARYAANIEKGMNVQARIGGREAPIAW